MNLAQAMTQLNAAAKETLQAIDLARQEAPHKIKPLLAHIQANLFNPDLRVGQLKRACGVRDNSISMQFHAAMGIPPSTYIEDCRMKVAAKMLRESEVPISMIAELLGYSSLQVFSTAFNRWAGIRPNPYRDQHRAAAAESGAEDEDLQSVERLRKALMGGLETREAEALIHYLQDIYSTQQDSQGLRSEPKATDLFANLPIATIAFEQQEAEKLWIELQQATSDQQRAIIRSGYRFRSPALFHLLRKKSREEGRDDRQRSVWLTELALESMMLAEQECLISSEVPVEVHAFANLKAQGWAWIGHARRLALDLAGAERAFTLAESQLPAVGRDRRVVAELYYLKSALRWYQRRFPEAITLASRAIPLLRLIGDPEPLAETLRLRAVIHQSMGEYQASLADLHEALQLIDERQSPYLMLATYQGLADTYTGSGLPQQAADFLAKAKALSPQVKGQSVRIHLVWSEALLNRAQGNFKLAEQRFLEARNGFMELRNTAHGAMVSLDLAILYAEQSRSVEALSLAAEALPLFVALLSHSQAATTATKILREMLLAKEVRLDLLQQVRSGFEQIQRDPTTRKP